MYSRRPSNRRDFSPPPPPPRDMPPLPPGPPPDYSVDRDRDSRRPGSFPPMPPQGGFSFRNDDSAPQYPRHQDTYRPPRQQNGPRIQDRARRPEQDRSKRFDRRGDRPNGRPFRGRRERVMPSDRPLVQSRSGENGSEQTLGVDAGSQKFMSLDDISDSEEENMDISDSDREADAVNESHSDGGIDEPPTKRRNWGNAEALDAKDVPRWSNPDPYSVLPPVEEGGRKRKDPVKLIRKAFKPVEKDLPVKNQVSANDDFISFNDGEDLSDSSDRASSEVTNTPNEICLDLGGSAYTVETGPFHTYDPLGSRKRTHDDLIKPGVRPEWVSPSHPDGSLLDEWVPIAASVATPWLREDTSFVKKAGFRLHREICDFYEFVKPQPFEQNVREGLLTRLQTSVSREFQGCTVHCFGSFAAGLYLPNADMDLVINSNTFQSTGEKVICQSSNKMFKFADFLRRSGLAKPNAVDVIAKAKVPIIKFVDRITEIRVDVSFENNTGITANDTFSIWKARYPAMPVLVTIIKQFLLMRGLNEVQHGGLGGFSVTCLVVSLLQNMPRVQAGLLVPEHHLGELLVEFLDFYGNRIDVARTGITMNPPGFFDKSLRNQFSLRGPGYQAHKPARLAIIDPNRADNDISGGSRNVLLIFERFSRAHSEILLAMKSGNRPSLLDWLLGGNYELFARHRNRLWELHNDLDVKGRSAWSVKENLPSGTHGLSTLQEPNEDQRARSQLESMTMDLNRTNVSYIWQTLDPVQSAVASDHPREDSEMREDFCESDDMIVEQDPPTNDAQQTRKHLLKLEANIARAEKLRELYPGICDVPNSISDSKKRKLIQDYTEKESCSSINTHETSEEALRARFFQKRYPNMKGVPDSLSVETAQDLLIEYLYTLRYGSESTFVPFIELPLMSQNEILKIIADLQSGLLGFNLVASSHPLTKMLAFQEGESPFTQGDFHFLASVFKTLHPDVANLPDQMIGRLYCALNDQFGRDYPLSEKTIRVEKERALRLKHQYPDSAGIPDSLTQRSSIALAFQLQNLAQGKTLDDDSKGSGKTSRQHFIRSNAAQSTALTQSAKETPKSVKREAATPLSDLHVAKKQKDTSYA